MRWMWLLWLASCGASPPPVAPIEPQVVEDESALDVAGRWRFTHDGADWLTLTFVVSPTEQTANVDAWHQESWTRFNVTRVKIDATSVRIEARYIEFPNTVTIELREESGALVGTVNGDTYGHPAQIRAVREPQ